MPSVLGATMINQIDQIKSSTSIDPMLKIKRLCQLSYDYEQQLRYDPPLMARLFLTIEMIATQDLLDHPGFGELNV